MAITITKHGLSRYELQRANKEIKAFREGKRKPIGYRCVNPECENKQEVPAK